MADIHNEFTDDEMRELLTAVLTEIRRGSPAGDRQPITERVEEALAARRANRDRG